MGTISEIVNNLRVASNPNNFVGDLAGFVDEKVRGWRSYKEPAVNNPNLHEIVTKYLPKSQSNYTSKIDYREVKDRKGSSGYYEPGSDSIVINTSNMTPAKMKDIQRALPHELAHARQASFLADLSMLPVKTAMVFDSVGRSLGSGVRYNATKGTDPEAGDKWMNTYRNSLAEIQARDMEDKKVPAGLPEADQTRLYDDMYRKSTVDSVGTYLRTLFGGR